MQIASKRGGIRFCCYELLIQPYKRIGFILPNRFPRASGELFWEQYHFSGDKFLQALELYKNYEPK